jgi:hypothetical protein
MRHLWPLALVAGCSFQPGTVSSQTDARGADGAGADDGTGDPDAPPDAAPIPIAFVQAATATNAGNNTFAAAAFASNQTAGNLNVVVVSWTDTNDGVAAVGDTSFNPYFSATAIVQAQGRTQRIYYASNIKAGPNLVTVAMSSNVPDPTIRIFEYSGIAASLPVDQVSSSSGNSATALAGPITTTQPRELLFGAVVASAMTTAPGAGYTSRQVDAGGSVEDQIVNTAGSYSADAPLQSASGWIMQLVSFKGIQ